MPVDNELYDRLGDTWWEEDALLTTLRTGLNPGRFGYMRRVLERERGADPRGARCLDVGCGGGLLAEEFARAGYRVTGVDPSEPSLRTARAHAASEGLQIEYEAGTGEELPFEDDSFDFVYCCDVLEHVDSLDRTIAAAARVLKPGGLYLYDTINRTLRSRLLLIKLMQEWEATRCMEPNLHDWEMFIKPQELEAVLRKHGLEPRETVGLAPAANPISVLLNLRRRARGKITFGELGRRIRMVEVRDRSALYAGYAVLAS